MTDQELQYWTTVNDRNYEFQCVLLGLLGVVASMGITANAEQLMKYQQGQEVAEVYESLMDRMMVFTGEANDSPKCSQIES